MKRWSGALTGLVLASWACSSSEPGSSGEEMPTEAIEPAQPDAPPSPGESATSEPQGSAAPSSEPAAPQPPPPMDVVLDDFEGGDGLAGEGFAVTWRTYSDGTGTVMPPEDAPVVPVDGAVQVSGDGFSAWGVGLSVDLDTSSGERLPVDLSAHRGLKLVARGSGTLDVELVLPATTGTEEPGGTCTEGCFGHYAATLTLSAEYSEQTLAFSAFRQPEWAAASPLDLSGVLAINLLSRANGGAASIDLVLDSVSLAAPLPAAPAPGGAGTVATAVAGNPFAGRALHSEGGAALAAYNAAQGADRELLAKVALNPTAYWLVGGDPGRAGSIADSAGGDYPVLVVYNIPDRDCTGQSAGGAGSADEYRSWIDAMAGSLAGKEAAIILEPDALALSCNPEFPSLIDHAVTSLTQNPGVAVYIDAGHSSWIAADVMAGRLREAGVEQATGFAVNVSNFQPTAALINYGRSLSAQLDGKPFVIDTSRNGGSVGGNEWCNPAGAGLGEAPTVATGDEAVHALLWVKRPGESDGACGQCESTQAGQFCTSYALELARNAVF